MSEKIIQEKSVNIYGVSFEYILTKNSTAEGYNYSIEIIEKNGNVRKTCRLKDIARSEETALRLFHMLSENAVSAASAPYVIDDLADSMTFC